MRKGWELKKLGEICDFQNGFAFKSKTYKESGWPILRITNIQDNNLETRKLVYFNDSDYKENFERFQVLKGDLVIAMSGATTGKLGVNNTNTVFYLNQRVGKFTPKANLSKSFLHYFLSTKIEESLKIAAGAAQPNLSTEQIKGFEIPTPTLEEQKQIVAILDKAFKAIDKAKENAEKNLKNAKELFESYLQEVFENKGDDWQCCDLEEYIRLIDYRGRTPIKTKSGVRLITAKNVKLGYLQLNPQEFIDAYNYESWMSRGIPNLGDVIFTTEAPLANVAQIDTREKLAFAQRIIVMQPDQKMINQSFLKYMLLSHPIRNKILENGTGATVLGIKSKLLKKIKISFPKAVKEQELIVNKLNQLQEKTKSLETIYQQKLTNLEELKKSILQKAFNGELETA